MSDLMSDGKDLFPAFDWSSNFSQQDGCWTSVLPTWNKDAEGTPQENVNSILSSKSMTSVLSREKRDMDLNDLNRSACSLATTITEVDMEDHEIMHVWETTMIDEEDCAIESILSLSQVCVEIGNPRDTATTARATCTAEKEKDQDARESFSDAENQKFWKNSAEYITSATQVTEEEKEGEYDDTREMFIDAEYEKFKEIGMQFLTKQRLPSKLKKNGFTACQA